MESAPPLAPTRTGPRVRWRANALPPDRSVPPQSVRRTCFSLQMSTSPGAPGASPCTVATTVTVQAFWAGSLTTAFALAASGFSQVTTFASPVTSTLVMVDAPALTFVSARAGCGPRGLGFGLVASAGAAGAAAGAAAGTDGWGLNR